MIIFQQMTIFFIIMLTGMIARKRGLITEENQGQLSGIVVDIANPALILSGSMGDVERIENEKLCISFGVAIGIFVLMIFLAKILSKLLGFRKGNYGIVELMFVFSNIGFMGIPMVVGLYGSQAVIYVTLFLIPFNIFVYTYGIYIISAKKDKQISKKEISLKNVCNVGVIASVVALVLYVFPVGVPYVVSEVITMLSKMTGPLSMLIIGASLLDIRWKELFTDVSLMAFTVLKMLLLPIIVLLILKKIINDEQLLSVCLIMLATPVGSMTLMLAGQYSKENYELAAKGIALTTIVSVITIPVVSWITGIG